jgi:hypothetical protein
LIALIVLSQKQAKLLVAQAIAKKIKDTTKRVYIAYGSTNQMILESLGINETNYFNGYVDNGLKVNKNRPEVIILNNVDENFTESINSNDIIIKGANALCYKDGKYRAAVAVASPNGGTYANVIIKASCVGAKVIIPVTHEKLVPYLLSGNYNQNSFDYVEGYSVALIEYTYGDIYTEINALKDEYDLNAQIYLAGGVYTNNKCLTFLLEGKQKSINELLEWKETII